MRKIFSIRKILFLSALVLIISCCIDEAAYAVAANGELISNSTFSNGAGLPWKAEQILPARAEFDVKNGKYSVTINNSGAERWDIVLSCKELVLERGHTYTVRFTVSASEDCSIYPKVSEQKGFFTEYWNYNQNYEGLNLKADEVRSVSDRFTVVEEPAEKCEFAFQLGGLDTSILPCTISFDDIYLTDSDSISPVLYGDVNNDMSIDAMDLALSRKFLLTRESALININAADVNADSSIDAIDYELIKQYLLGEIIVFPAGSRVLKY